MSKSSRTKAIIATVAALAGVHCDPGSIDPIEPERKRRSGGTELWEDQTGSTIGTTQGWTHKLELADLNGDGLVDLLFAHGAAYSTPGPVPEKNQVFLNKGPAALARGERMFEEISGDVFGARDRGDFARTIKARDVDGDGDLDVFVGTAYHRGPSRLFIQVAPMRFEEKTSTHLPQKDGEPVTTSIGDAEFGDVDGDGDLDLVLADWGEGDPCRPRVPGCFSPRPPLSPGGRIMLWKNDGSGRFEDATSTQMPEGLVRFSWDLEFVDIDNDLDLDLAIASKATLGGEGSFLYENVGGGRFEDVTLARVDDAVRLPPAPNNYEFEVIDINRDGFLDLITLNDGERQTASDQFDLRERILVNGGAGQFLDQTAALWPPASNIGEDDNQVAVFDFDSDGDSDFLIGSLFGSGGPEENGDGIERLIVNNLTIEDGAVVEGTTLDLLLDVIPSSAGTPGTLGIAVADLNDDGRWDVVQSQGESAFGEKVYFGTEALPVDSSAPVVALADQFELTEDGELLVRARVYDHKTPVAGHDFDSVVVKTAGDSADVPMTWYGGTLWRAALTTIPDSYQVCATDRAGNETCSDAVAPSR